MEQVNIATSLKRLKDELKNEIEATRDALEVNEKGMPERTIANCQTALELDPVMKGAFRKNQLTGLIDVVRPMFWHREGIRFTDNDLTMTEVWLGSCYKLHGTTMVLKALRTVANENQYHPVQEYLNKLTWDGTPRIREALHHFLGAEVNDFNEESLRVFMYGALERVFHPGCKFELMLCLTGGQGAGKSTFFRLLSLQDEWFSDDLKKLDDENVYRKLQGHWIIEMSEMIATANARSIEEIKAFLSRQKETYKTPYGVHPEDRPRQCVFAGTTNRQDFLPMDRSGNRRFLPVAVDAAQAEVHPLADEQASRAYIDQMWAEAMVKYKAGEYSLHLSEESEKMLSKMQEAFTQEDTVDGLIIAFMEDYKGKQVCSRQLYREALGRTHEPTPKEIRNVSNIVTAAIADQTLIGWQAFFNPRRFPEYGTQRGWERIPEDVDVSC